MPRSPERSPESSPPREETPLLPNPQDTGKTSPPRTPPSPFNVSPQTPLRANGFASPEGPPPTPLTIGDERDERDERDEVDQKPRTPPTVTAGITLAALVGILYFLFLALNLHAAASATQQSSPPTP